jgi:hypothetical protein
MRITRIDFEGNSHVVTITREPHAPEIGVTIVYPNKPRDVFSVDPANTRELWGLVVEIQRLLDGCAGTNSMVQDYLRAIRCLAD